MDETEAQPPQAIPPGLHLVATPIGHARDITLRALDVLRGADLVAAEDTRRVRQLMSIHAIPRAGREIVAYHDHNAVRAGPRLLAALAEGRSVAYVSDAGTPLVADPGHRLVREALAAGHPVHAVPGPVAAIAALTVAGLPTDRFLFAGFLPAKEAGRRKTLTELAAVPATLIFYEGPHRIEEALRDMAAVLGAARPAALARELTKRHEEVLRGSVGTLLEEVMRRRREGRPLKGEMVVLVGPPAAKEAGEAEIERALAAALSSMSVKDSARFVADTLNLPRKRIYQKALEMRRQEKGRADDKDDDGDRVDDTGRAEDD